MNSNCFYHEREYDEFMRKSERLKQKVTNYFFDHYIQKDVLDYSLTILLSVVSGIIFAFGFAAFITVYSDGSSLRLATGGFSGFIQSIVLLVTNANKGIDPTLLQSILYFSINIPAILFAFFKIGKRFAITTAVNVGVGSLFIYLFGQSQLIRDIAENQYIAGAPLCRVLFAGICTGVSSGIAFKGGTSCGGMDIVVCYLSLRKSTGAGKYNIYINFAVIAFYTICNVIVNQNNIVEALLIVPFAVVYFLVSSLVIDTIHVRNRKILVEVVTDVDYMSDILVSIFPHSCTLLEGKGAYSKAEKHIIKMVISSFETKRVVSYIKRIDQNAFITLTPLNQVYGNFFINSVE